MYQDFVNALSREVLGQPAAVKAFARTAVRAVDRLFRGDRPAGVLLVTGPTGCGKSYLTEVLARILLGSERLLVRVNVSLDAEAEASARRLSAALGGAPRGAAPGQPVPRVILLEGLQKASVPVRDLYTHILSRGEAHLLPGGHLDFRRTVFVVDSGGEEENGEEPRAVGFEHAGLEARARVESREREQLRERVERAFPPRFLSIVDEIVVFRRIRDEDFPAILQKNLTDLVGVLARTGLAIHFDDVVLDFVLAEARQRVQFGARAVRQAVDRFVETPVLDLLHSCELRPGSAIYVRKSPEGLLLLVPEAAWQGGLGPQGARRMNGVS